MKIAIDGPAGSGKSAAAMLLAKKLNFLYIDTGAMYRGVTLQGIREGINFENEALLTEIAERLPMDVRQDWSTDRGYRIFFGNEDVTAELFTPQVDGLVSVTAKVAGVRRIQVIAQRRLAEKNDVVMAGRDIGSHVLPDARPKIFLTADETERAKRRRKELAQKGVNKDLAEIVENIRFRDKTDSERKTSPLVKAPDAVALDNTNLSVEETVEEILRIIGGREK